MAFSIEPGIYLEGRYGARIEDIVVCGDDGPTCSTRPRGTCSSSPAERLGPARGRPAPGYHPADGRPPGTGTSRALQ